MREVLKMYDPEHLNYNANRLYRRRKEDFMTGVNVKILALIAALALALVLAFFTLPSEAQSYYDGGAAGDGVWTVMPPENGFQTIYTPTGTRTIIYHGSQGYGGAGVADYYNYYNRQFQGGYSAGYNIGRGLRRLFSGE